MVYNGRGVYSKLSSLEYAHPQTRSLVTVVFFGSRLNDSAVLFTA